MSSAPERSGAGAIALAGGAGAARLRSPRARRPAQPILCLYGPLARVALLAGDLAVVALALAAAAAIRPDAAARIGGAERFAVESLALGTIVAWALHLYDLYRFSTIRNLRELLVRAALAVGLASALMVLAFYLAPSIDPGQPGFVAFAAVLLPLVLAWRAGADRAVRRFAPPPRVLVAGATRVGTRVAETLREARDRRVEVVGFVDDALVGGARAADMPVLGRIDEVETVVRDLGVTHVAIAAPDPEIEHALPVLLRLRDAGIRIESAADLYEDVTGRLLVERLTPSWVLLSGGLEKTPIERAVKRAVGAVVSGVALLALLPFLLLVALLVKLDSPGPVLFRQERVGERGRRFLLYKFRTMRRDAEAATGPIWAQENDPRVTRLGRILRKTRIDELPQLLNVLRGDMAFVGPRPERPAFVEMLAARIPFYEERHRVKPGITGWAQINYRYGASVEDAERKLRYDLYYIRNLTPLLDLDVVIGTFRVMLAGENLH